MKRLIGSVTVLMVLTYFAVSCEKDDICAEGSPTTPSLVVEFYNKDNGEELVNLINFRYYAVGETDTLPAVEEGVTTSFSKIELPLRTNANTTKWGLIFTRRLSNGQFTEPNTDFLEFNYETQEAYISRACGFATTFELDPNVIHTDSEDADGLWIDSYDVEITNIEDESETHIKIYL